MTERTWQFSAARLQGHRERLGLSRTELGVLIGRRQDTVKRIEYGLNLPSLGAFLLLADSLGISPNDLCRTHLDDKKELEAGRRWPMPLDHER